jgi:hypothetical protein
MSPFVFILLSVIIECISSSQTHPGHLKPFGSAGSLLSIKELSGTYPSISKLFTYHIAKSEPIVCRQVVNNDIHYSLWQSDEELENNVVGLSTSNVLVQSYRERERIQMSFGDFLHRYQREQLFLADNLPDSLRYETRLDLFLA